MATATILMGVSMALTAVSTVMALRDNTATDQANEQLGMERAQADEDFNVAQTNAQLAVRRGEQADAKANNAQATSQRDALRHYQQAKNEVSLATAVAGASGAGAGGFAGFDNLIGDLFQVHEYNGLNALFSGDSMAQSLRDEGAYERWNAVEIQRKAAVNFNTATKGSYSRFQNTANVAAAAKKKKALEGAASIMSAGKGLSGSLTPAATGGGGYFAGHTTGPQ